MRGARTSGNGGRKWIDGLVQLQSSWQQCSILLSAVDCGNSSSEQRVCILEPRYEPGLRECRVGVRGSALNRRTQRWLCCHIPHFRTSQGLSVPGTVHSLSDSPSSPARLSALSHFTREKIETQPGDDSGVSNPGLSDCKAHIFFSFFLNVAVCEPVRASPTGERDWFRN